MKSDRELIQEAIEGWTIIRKSPARSRITDKRKLGNHLAQAPLCEVYKPPFCQGCPVERATSRTLCHHTPFDKARANVVDWAKGLTRKAPGLIDSQIAFLRSLEELERKRKMVETLLDEGPVLGTKLCELLSFSPSKLSWFMRTIGCHTTMARGPKYKKIVLYEKPKTSPRRLAPAYECERCERFHPVEREQAMPFVLVCAECKGVLHLTSVDYRVKATHRIVGDTLQPR